MVPYGPVWFRMADLQIILVFLAALANPFIISLKVCDFSPFSSESIYVHLPHYLKMRVSTFLLNCSLDRNSIKIFV